MGHEGVVLVTRVAVVLVLIVFGAIVRTFIGPSRKRGEVMGLGTLAGITAGVFVGQVIRGIVGADLSAPFAAVGMVVGWTVAWRFARHLPRTAS